MNRVVAIACDSSAGLAGNVSPHFGHSPAFVVAELDGQTVVTSRVVVSPGHGAGCSMPGFVRQLGASTLIVGGLGAGAVAGLASAGIEVVAGVSGSAAAALAALVKGELASGPSSCSGHGGHGHGDGHRCGHHE